MTVEISNVQNMEIRAKVTNDTIVAITAMALTNRSQELSERRFSIDITTPKLENRTTPSTRKPL